MRRINGIPALVGVLVVAACTSAAQTSRTEVDAKHAAPPPVEPPEFPAPADDDEWPAPDAGMRWSCTDADDCWNTCALGAVNRTWYLSLPPHADCEDGCANVDAATPRCESGQCVAYDHGGTPVAECSRREADVPERRDTPVSLKGHSRSQTTSGPPGAYIAFDVTNPTARTVSLLLLEVQVMPNGGPPLLAGHDQDFDIGIADGAVAPRSPRTIPHGARGEIPPRATRRVLVRYVNPDDLPNSAFPYSVRAVFLADNVPISAVSKIQKATRHRVE